MDSTLQISFTGEDTIDTEEYSVVMFQQKSPYSDSVSLSQILGMSAMASAGTSAFDYAKSTNIYFTEDGTVMNIPLIFYVLPTPTDLAYSLSLMGTGEIQSIGTVSYTQTGNIVVPLTNQIEMQAPITSNTFEWETPCYNKEGEIVSPPSYSVNGKYINFDETVFGVLRGTFVYTAHKYKAILQFQKTELMGTGEETHNKISAVDCSVVCTYSDTEGEAQEVILELSIPRNAELFLEECPDTGEPKVSVESEPDTPTSHTIYWYSTCDGSIIDFHTEET